MTSFFKISAVKKLEAEVKRSKGVEPARTGSEKLNFLLFYFILFYLAHIHTKGESA